MEVEDQKTVTFTTIGSLTHLQVSNSINRLPIVDLLLIRSNTSYLSSNHLELAAVMISASVADS